jgi:alanine racemase
VNASRPTVAEINLKNIAHNLRGVRAKVGANVKIMAVVKANAYGHGLVEVSRHIQSQVDYLGVATAEEGAVLREAGIKKPVLVFTLPNAAQARIIATEGLDATVCSLREAELLERAARRSRTSISIHLKIETGMNRIGVRPQEVGALLRDLRRHRHLELRGAYTHFATADDPNKEFARQQLSRFHRGLEAMHKEGGAPSLCHCANSAAVLDLPEAYFDMVRPGLMLYGYDPTHQKAPKIPLKRAMTLKTEVSLIKRIEPGESVSYGRRFIAGKRTTIATLPIGYADGYTRLLSGKAHALIHGERFPVVGLICMDQLMVDVGNAPVRVGDEAVLLGEQGGEVIDAWHLADQLGTIPYEICCAISARVPRVYSKS